MTEVLYVVQTVVAAVVLLLLLGRKDAVLRVYASVWMIANLVIAYRYGLDGQLRFYSNDQAYYVNVIKSVVGNGLPFDIDWWMTASRWPYTLPAALLSLAGVSPTLSGKIVSLLFLLASVRLVRAELDLTTRRETLVGLYLTALGTIGLFFSVLALRETMMIYLVFVLFLGKNPSRRVVAATLLFFLRQHLAIAIVLGLVASTIIRRARGASWTPAGAVLALLGGNALGYALFSLGFQYQTGVGGVFGHRFGIEPVIRIFSNYFGLQFLAVAEESREFGLVSLLASRLVFSETIVIPTLFTAVALTSRRLDFLGRSVLLGFSVYVGLVTNTEFNSFRQNIPIIPVMGLVVAQHFLTRGRTAEIAATGSRET